MRGLRLAILLLLETIVTLLFVGIFVTAAIIAIPFFLCLILAMSMADR